MRSLAVAGKYRSQYFEGGRVSRGQSALDIGSTNQGQALGVPVLSLLGGKHRNVIRPSPRPARSGDETIEDAKKLMARGWSTIVLPAEWNDAQGISSRASHRQDREILIKAREALGETVGWG